MTAKKFGKDKPPLGLIPAAALEAEALGFAAGRVKYGQWNYLEGRGLTYVELLDGAMRHMKDFLAGQDYDLETGIHNLGLARCGLGMVLDYEARRMGIDDRCPKLPKYTKPMKIPLPEPEFQNPPIQDDTMFDNCKVKFSNEPTRIYTQETVPSEFVRMAVGKPHNNSV